VLLHGSEPRSGASHRAGRPGPRPAGVDDGGRHLEL